MLSFYQFMKQKLIFITKIYTQEIYFYWSDQGCISQKQWSQVLSLQIEFNENNDHS